ncbi:MAG: citrate synthase [Bdellovibrionales bacterium]|jgi:citrate synthase|nr:citrate synthase [Bdellovibrionales bacterium]
MASAKIVIDGKTYEVPIIEGTEGERAIDISKLRAESKVITYDNGFGNTGSCQSAVTFLNGEKGILHYRGYPIEQLAEKSTFVECSYLLNYGELPKKSELRKFDKAIRSSGKIPKGIKDIIDSFPKKAHPMAVCSSSMVALSGFYPELNDVLELDDKKKMSIITQLMGQILTMSTRFYRNSQGKAPRNPKEDLDYCSNFLYMMGMKPDPELAKALDTLLILHADHEQNCSASTVRVIGSAQANVFASISGGIDALWGPLHGGANQAVLEMLEQIQKDGGDSKKALQRAKNKEDSFRLMGFGHRVYKNFDPRAKIIKKACDTVLSKLGVKDPLLDIARALEEEALKDPYFVERKLYPNVDFYSGIIYRALGIPTNMFTVMFAIGRLPGWLSQWKEMLEFKGTKIVRPRQIYVGENHRDYLDIKKR